MCVYADETYAYDEQEWKKWVSVKEEEKKNTSLHTKKQAVMYKQARKKINMQLWFERGKINVYLDREKEKEGSKKNLEFK